MIVVFDRRDRAGQGFQSIFLAGIVANHDVKVVVPGLALSYVQKINVQKINVQRYFRFIDAKNSSLVLVFFMRSNRNSIAARSSIS